MTVGIGRKPDPVLDGLEGEIERTLDTFGYECVQLKLGGRVGNQTLTVVIDKPGGVTSSDCAYVTDRLSVLLDALDPIQGRYTLMVSSPGVDRPLTREADFQRFAGQQARIRWSRLGEGRQTHRGVLDGIQDGKVRLQVEGQEMLIPLEDIETANIAYDWDQAESA